MRTLTLLSVVGLLATSALAQQKEVIVQAANTSAPAPAAAAPILADATESDFAEIMKMLQAMKLQNNDILKKQQVAMDALDELQKAADQIRIFSKRG